MGEDKRMELVVGVGRCAQGGVCGDTKLRLFATASTTRSDLCRNLQRKEGHETGQGDGLKIREERERKRKRRED
jgi:hypothetical protein